MRLSEAIRIGSKLRPQGHGSLFTKRTKTPLGQLILDQETKSCALGAAYEASLGFPSDWQWWNGNLTNNDLDGYDGYDGHGSLLREFPILGQPVGPYVRPEIPLGPNDKCTPISNYIYHLNDKLGLSREEIADWAEGIELQQEIEAALNKPEEAETEAPQLETVGV